MSGYYYYYYSMKEIYFMKVQRIKPWLVGVGGGRKVMGGGR